MTPFDSQKSEPDKGDEVIVCPHIAAGNDVGEMKFRYANPPTKQITASGQYLRANWSACCQSCYSDKGGDGDKINFTQVVTWPVEVKKGENNESRRGVFLKEGEKVVVCEHMDPTHPGVRRQGGAIFWLDECVKDCRIKHESHGAVAIVLCEKCSGKFAKDPDSVRTGGTGNWKDESGLPPETGHRVAHLDKPETDWPPSAESVKKKATVTDSSGENPKAETGQQVVPPPPGVRLADSVTDPRRDEEQRHVMAHGGGGLPPVEQSPPKEPKDFEGPPSNAITDHDAESSQGFKENRPDQPGKGEVGETGEHDSGKKHKKGK